MGLLIKYAARQTDAEFRRWPIWAFLSLRSTQDPWAKVAAHCRATQQLISNHRSTPQARAELSMPSTCFGGLQIFVDLEKAFDSVNRAKLFARLSELPIDDNIICLLHCWHVETDYFVTHGGESVAVPVTQGLRQGCKGAPFLWNSLMVLMLHDLNCKVSYQWIVDHVTLYADDIHVGGI